MAAYGETLSGRTVGGQRSQGGRVGIRGRRANLRGKRLHEPLSYGGLAQDTGTDRLRGNGTSYRAQVCHNSMRNSVSNPLHDTVGNNFLFKVHLLSSITTIEDSIHSHTTSKTEDSQALHTYTEHFTHILQYCNSLCMYNHVNCEYKVTC